MRAAVERVLGQYPQAAQEFRDGKEKAIGFLMGQTMRTLQGRADPALVSCFLREKLA